jgi:hypothetical protein
VSFDRKFGIRYQLSPSNTEISSEGRVIVSIADLVCFISLFGGSRLAPELSEAEIHVDVLTPSTRMADTHRSRAIP